jgi:hypothetical protein
MRLKPTKLTIETDDETLISHLRPYFHGDIYSFEDVPFVFVQYNSVVKPGADGAEIKAVIEFQEVIVTSGPPGEQPTERS